MIPLKYQTSSQKFILGQFISTDGNTVLSTLTINSSDVTLLKHNSTSVNYKSTTGLTHISSGFYGGQFSSDDADTYGSLRAFVHVAGSLMVKEVFRVETANIYDAITSTGTFMYTNVSSMNSGVISSAQISSGALYSSAHILSSVAFSSGFLSSVSFSSGAISSLAFGTAALTSNAFSSGWISSLSFNTGAISSQAVSSGFISSNSMSSGAISTITISTAAWDQSALSVWSESTKLLSSGAVVWSAATRTLTNISSGILSSGVIDYISTGVWDYGTKALTDKAGFSLSTSQSVDITGNITGNLSGSVGSVTGNVGGSVASLSSMSTAVINSIQSGIAKTTDLSAVALTTTANDEIFNVLIESTISVKNTLKIILAESAGASTGGGTSTAVFYSPNSSAARITATVSSDGNRTTPTFDLT